MEGHRAFNHRNLRGNGFHVRNRDLQLEVEDAEVTDDVMLALTGGSHLSVSRGSLLGCWLSHARKERNGPGPLGEGERRAG